MRTIQKCEWILRFAGHLLMDPTQLLLPSPSYVTILYTSPFDFHLAWEVVNTNRGPRRIGLRHAFSHVSLRRGFRFGPSGHTWSCCRGSSLALAPCCRRCSSRSSSPAVDAGGAAVASRRIRLTAFESTYTHNSHNLVSVDGYHTGIAVFTSTVRYMSDLCT